MHALTRRWLKILHTRLKDKIKRKLVSLTWFVYKGEIPSQLTSNFASIYLFTCYISLTVWTNYCITFSSIAYLEVGLYEQTENVLQQNVPQLCLPYKIVEDKNGRNFWNSRSLTIKNFVSALKKLDYYIIRNNFSDTSEYVETNLVAI